MHFMYSKPNSWPAPSSLRKNGTLFFLRLSQPSKRHVLPVSQTKNLHAILDSPLLLKPHIQVLSKCCWLYLQTYGGRAPSLFVTPPPSIATGTIWHPDYCCPLPLGSAVAPHSLVSTHQHPPPPRRQWAFYTGVLSKWIWRWSYITKI